jgi:hypothetical protein
LFGNLTQKNPIKISITLTHHNIIIISDVVLRIRGYTRILSSNQAFQAYTVEIINSCNNIISLQYKALPFASNPKQAATVYTSDWLIASLTFHI